MTVSKTYRKMISIAENYKDVRDAIQEASKVNKASYLVCEAIRFYLCNKDNKVLNKDLSMEEVKAIIKQEIQLLNNIIITTSAVEGSDKIKEVPIGELDINSIEVDINELEGFEIG